MPPLTAPNEFIVIDVETTGFKPEEGHVVIEVAGQKMRGQSIAEQFHSLVKANRLLDPKNVEFNGISEALLAAEGKSPAEVFPTFRTFVGSSVLIGHNLLFDLAFLNMHLRQLGLPMLENQTLDTLELAKRYLIIPSYSLAAVAQYLGVAQPAAHRALADVETTRRVFLKLVERAIKVGR